MIFVDAPQPFAAVARPFITRATKFLLIIEPSVLGVTSAHSTLVELVRFGIPVSRIMIVSNSRDGKPEVMKNDIDRALGSPIALEIPPRSDRRFGKVIDTLRETLLHLPEPDPLDTLQPSTSTPIGDRRDAHSRRTGAAAAGPGRALTGNSGFEERLTNQLNATQEPDERTKLKAEVHAALAERLEQSGITVLASNDTQRLAEMTAEIKDTVSGLLAGRPEIGSAEEIAYLRQEILDEVLGYGPLEELMRDDSISEIMVNGAKEIFIERSGQLIRSRQTFSDDRQLRLVIERMLAPIGRRIDESQPMVDGRLADGSRINAIISPLALDGSSLTIRRFGKKRLQCDDLIRLGAFNEAMAEFVKACVQARLNIVISGGTGSGKTTFLNMLSNFIPETERIVTIEDAAELLLNQEHVVRLESRPPNLEGKGEIRIRELVKNALRMRPDRMVVGECRGGEALDMLQAMNTGHDGSITTAHSNAPRDTISRIETMVMMAGFDLPIRAIREQIASAIDIIIQVSRMRDGSRKVVNITEVVGMEGDIVTMQDIVTYRIDGLDEQGKVKGQFLFTGVQPNCLKRFEESGIKFDITKLASMGSTPAMKW
jgi:pilus assembly protein CpaF